MKSRNPKTITINVDWNSLDSIESAEKLKLKLENKNYAIVNQFGGMFHSVIVMAKID